MLLLSEAQDRLSATTGGQLGSDLQVCFFLFMSTPASPFLFRFGKSDWFASVLVNASLEEWNANIRQNPVAGPVAARLPPTSMPIRRSQTPLTPTK